MDITPDLSDFLTKALKRVGMTQAKLAERLGVQVGTVNRWITGNGVRTIRPQHWEALQKLLCSELPEEMRTELLRRHAAKPATMLMAAHPIVTVGDLRGFNPLYGSITDLRGGASGKAFFETAGSEMFAFRLADDDMAPLFPQDTIILVKADSGAPRSGSLCLAAIREGEGIRIACRLWYADARQVELRAIHPDAKSYHWTVEELSGPGNPLIWRYPVVELADRLKWG